MKRTITLLLSLIVATAMLAQEERHLSAIFSYATFNDPEGTPYVETYFVFDGNSLVYQRSEGTSLRATVELTLLVKKADTVVYAKRHALNSPVAKLPLEEDYREYEMPDFIDMQRFALPNGEYTMHFEVRDVHSTEAPVTVEEQLSVHFTDQPQLSSVQPMGDVVKTQQTNILSRSGYDMTPYISDFYPEGVKSLSFYYEIYNIDREVGEEPFVTLAYVEQRETGRRYEAQMAVKRQQGQRLVPVFGTIDISELPSGNYNLVVEARTKDEALMLYHKVPFMRSNPKATDRSFAPYAASFVTQITDESLMDYYLAALYPIALPKEEAMADALVAEHESMAAKQEFFYEFWLSRDGLNPEGAWNKYLERLNYVDAHFSYAKRRGYLTDRGRVYLQYGPPDFVRDEKNFVSVKHIGSIGKSSQGHVHYLPYQLWRYNLIPGDDINRCFLFWDEQRSGYYLLLQSNAKGEVRDPLWERRLCQQQIDEDVVGEVGEQFNRGY